MFTPEQEYKIATEKWIGLGAEENYTRALSKPALAIMVSAHGDAQHYMREAEEINNFYAVTGEFSIQHTIPKLDATRLRDILQDPDYTDVIVIGKGNREEVWTGHGLAINWLEVAAMMQSHLKNSFTYRNHAYNQVVTGVPLGLFAAGDHNKVYVPEAGSLHGIKHGEGRFVPASDTWQMSFDDIGKNSPRGN